MFGAIHTACTPNSRLPADCPRLQRPLAREIVIGPHRLRLGEEPDSSTLSILSSRGRTLLAVAPSGLEFDSVLVGTDSTRRIRNMRLFLGSDGSVADHLKANSDRYGSPIGPSTAHGDDNTVNTDVYMWRDDRTQLTLLNRRWSADSSHQHLLMFDTESSCPAAPAT